MMAEAVRRINEARDSGAKVLDLQGLRLRELPGELAALTGLTELRLAGNRLTKLPGWVARLQGLTRLDIRANNFTTVPEPILHLTKLTALDLGVNTYAEISPRIADLRNLTELSLGDAGATEVPGWLSTMPHLVKLSIGAGTVTSLPGWMKEMRQLRCLSVCDNPLSELPDWIGELSALTELTSDTTGLTALPESLTCLQELTTLNVSYNRLAELPEWLGELARLENLCANSNQLTTLPASITGLRRLHFGGNRVDRIPDWISELTGLIELVLGYNGITKLPEWLSALTGLTRLDIGGCQLIAVPDWLAGFTKLTRLDASSNGLVRIPEWIGELDQLTTLHLNRNRLHELPARLSELAKLSWLGLESNRFTTLPGCLAQLTGLRALLVADNYLTTLPSWITGLTNLTRLGAGNNQLTELPENIGRLTSLEVLHASSNQLRTLPLSISELTNLDYLLIDDNQITSLPGNISNLADLRSLQFHNNRISRLPDSLIELHDLRDFTLTGNPLLSPPPEIAAAGRNSVMAFLWNLRQGSSRQWVSKLLVVGEGGVGKTSLVKALAGDPHDRDEPSTHGMRIKHLFVPHPSQTDVAMRLSAWDFGGQEIYHATHQFFLTNRSLFLLLWNARLGWEQGKLPYWLDIITARAPQSPVILVATHIEGRPVDLPLDDLRREYPMIVGCLSVDNENREGFDALGGLLTEQAAALPLMGAEWPAKWLAAAEFLRMSSKKHVTPERMWHMMAQAGVDDPVQRRYIAVALHELGDILYYSEDPELCRTVVLRPEWVNEYISKVLDSEEVAAAHGLLSRKHLNELWWDLDQGMRDHFLGMMDKYDLSYRVDGSPDDVSLVVERLSWNAPPYQEQWDAMAGQSEIRVLYRLNTMPPGIPTWFIARSHRFSTNTHWRTGAVLRHGAQLALVRADTHRKTVSLTVRGPSPAAFFSILDDGLNRTLERFPGLEISREVPCRCSADCTELYNYDNLSSRLARVPPRRTIECHGSGELVDIPGLLLGLAPSEQDATRMSIDQVAKTLTRIEDKVTENAEYNQRMFMRLQHIAQVQQETRCPSVFALVPVKGKRRYELRLYCEEPGAWHRLPAPSGCYPISRPAEWFRKAGPYLQGLLKVLKHTAPLAGPILGIAVDQLDSQLKSDCDLMKELANQMPSQLHSEDELRGYSSAPASRASTDADFRALEAMLVELDPDRTWGGLSRTTTPEGLTLYLCSDHRKAYLP